MRRGTLTYISSTLVSQTRRSDPKRAERLAQWQGHQAYVDAQGVVTHVPDHCLSTCRRKKT